MMNWLLPGVPAVLAILAVLYLAGLAVAGTREVRIANRLRRIGHSGADLAEYDVPAWKTVLAVLSARLLRPKGREELAGRLAAAGMHDAWYTDAFLVVRAALVLSALAGGYFLFDVDLAGVFRNPLPMFKYLVLVAVCGRLPDFWLKGRLARNRDLIVASVPQAIDFMTICVEAGLSLEDSFQKAGEEMRASAPEVAAEIRATRSEMLMLGRIRALQRMKKRSGVLEIENLADALLQSIRFGTPLVDALQGIASESRARQVSNLEERAGSISAKVGIPLILLVLFPLIVLLVAPVVVSFYRTM